MPGADGNISGQCSETEFFFFCAKQLQKPETHKSTELKSKEEKNPSVGLPQLIWINPNQSRKEVHADVMFAVAAKLKHFSIPSD